MPPRAFKLLGRAISRARMITEPMTLHSVVHGVVKLRAHPARRDVVRQLGEGDAAVELLDQDVMIVFEEALAPKTRPGDTLVDEAGTSWLILKPISDGGGMLRCAVREVR